MKRQITKRKQKNKVASETMDLNFYFEPVALDKPEHSLRPDQAMLGQNIRIHTPSLPIDEDWTAPPSLYSAP